MRLSVMLLAMAGALALTMLCSADDRLKSFEELRSSLATQTAAVQIALRGVEAADATLGRAKEAFNAADAALRPVLSEEAALRMRIEEADHWLLLQALPAEIATALPQRERTRDDLKAHLERIGREEESRRLLGNTAPDEQRPLIEYSLSLFQGNIAYLHALDAELKRVLPGMAKPAFAGARTVEQARTDLGREWEALQLRLQPLRQNRTATLSAMRAAGEACKRSAEAHRIAERERLRLLYVLATEAAPPYLRSIRAEAVKETRAEHRIYYTASVAEPPEEIELRDQVALMLEGLAEAHAELAVRRTAYQDSEARFRQAAQRWDEAYERAVALQYHAYYWRIGLESADAVVGVLKDGASPAVLLFELGYRIGEGFTQEFRIEEPPVADSILAYRERIASQLAVDGSRDLQPEVINDEQWLRAQHQYDIDHASWFSSESERLKAHLEGEQVGELKKGAINKGVNTFFRTSATAIRRRGGSPRDFVKYIDAKICNPDYEKEVIGRAAQLGEAVGLPEPVLRMIRGEDAAGRVLKQSENALVSAGKDVVFAAGVTAVKEFAISFNQDARARVATELVLLDIEWLMRRHEYHARGALYRAFRDECAALEAEIGAAIEDFGRGAAARILTVETSNTLSTSDALAVHLEFTAPVTSATIALGERTFTDNVVFDSAITVRVPANALKEGENRLAITCIAPRQGPLASQDGDPLTIAHFNSGADFNQPASSVYAGYELRADRSHTLKAAAPGLTIVNPKPGYLRGDWIDVEYVLPGSTAHRRVWLTAYPMQQPRDAFITGERGTAQYQVPPDAREYRLLMLEDDNAEWLANVPFTVAHAVARDLGKGDFTDAYQVALSDRGPSLPRSDAPMPEGAGRVYLEARDAGMQSIGPGVSIRQSGSQEQFTYAYGGRSIDLPAGAYDFFFGYTAGVEVRGVSVAAGSEQTVHAGVGDSAVGRVTFACKSGIGEEIGPGISIRRAGSEEQLTYTYGGHSLDLPPGEYDIYFGYIPTIQRKALAVAAGHETVITASGYGRLQLDALDGVNQPTGVGVSIWPVGAEAQLTYTYGGHHVDLPPGEYNLYYGYVPNIEFKNVRVNAGQVTTKTASGYGRLQLDALDGVNQPTGVGVSIWPVGAKQQLTYTYGGHSVDLPPGEYDLYYGYVPNIEFKNVRVNAGEVTTKTASGYGRVTFAMFNGRGEPVGQGISIRWREDEQITYTYGGHSVDLPPGGYVASHQRGNEAIRTPFTIAAGANTTVTLGAD